MPCLPTQIVPSSNFQRDIGHYRKSYPSVDDEVCQALIKEIGPDPLRGDAIRNFAGRVRKLRIPNKDINQGKSGGFRLIYDWEPQGRIMTLLRLFSKKDIENIADAEIKKARKQANLS